MDGGSGEVIESTSGLVQYKAIVRENSKCVLIFKCRVTHRIVQGQSQKDSSQTAITILTCPESPAFVAPRDKEEVFCCENRAFCEETRKTACTF